MANETPRFNSRLPYVIACLFGLTLFFLDITYQVFDPLDQIKKRIQDLIKYSDIQDKKKTLIIWPEGVFSGYSYNDLKQL